VTGERRLPGCAAILLLAAACMAVLAVVLGVVVRVTR
jgi:hypothetical protein